MTREEAAKILDPETTLDAYAKISYYGGFEGESAWQDAVNEACRMGAAALRALDAKGNQKPLTLEGVHHASVGDYIIKGVKGEFYPCKSDIFANTYEEDDHAE